MELLAETMLLLARREGILLEYVYTAITLYGLRDLISRGILPPQEAVCFLYTGGIGALFGQADCFHDSKRN